MATDIPALDLGMTLALAVVAASQAPMLLLDDNLAIVAASDSFCAAFGIDPGTVTGMLVYDLDDHAWNVPRLRSLLDVTLSGMAAIERYELEITLPALGRRSLVLKAQMLEYGDAAAKRLLLAVADVTEARDKALVAEELERTKAMLVSEVEHRVANSLQIIASILMQSARSVQSEEARGHLTDARQRVMSIAALQRQLAESGAASVDLAPYLSQLCASIGASMIYDHKQLTLLATVAPQTVAAAVSVSLGLVVTELVINALKHAYPDNRRGCVRVEYSVDGAKWTLSVCDDGIGMPKAPGEIKSGLGTSIVRALAKQLGAEVTVVDMAPGTRVSLVHGALAMARDAANDVADRIAV